MKTLYFVRHGTVHNPNRVTYRRLPGFLLSEHGRREAGETATFLRNVAPQAIFHSPLERAMETAEIINAYHSVPLHIEERINEWAESESPEEVQQRMRTFFEEWRDRGPGITIAVSHRDPIRRLLFDLHDEPWPFPDLADRYPLSQAGVYRITDSARGIEAAHLFTPEFSTDRNL